MAEEAGTEDASPPLAGAEGGGGDDDDDGGGSEAIPETRAVVVEEEVRDLKKLNGKRRVEEEEEASEGTNDLHRSARLPLPIFPFSTSLSRENRLQSLPLDRTRIFSGLDQAECVNWAVLFGPLGPISLLLFLIGKMTVNHVF